MLWLWAHLVHHISSLRIIYYLGKTRSLCAKQSGWLRHSECCNAACLTRSCLKYLGLSNKTKYESMIQVCICCHSCSSGCAGGEENAKWKFFSKASSHLSYYSNHHRLTQEAASLVNKGLIPAWAAFPMPVKAQRRAERPTWVSLCRESHGRPTEGNFVKVLF